MAKDNSKKATSVADASAVPPPAGGALTPPPVNAPADAGKKGAKKTTCYEFVKNFKTFEEMMLKNKEKFTFPNNPFHTTDAELAEELRKVAHLYRIIENPPSEV